jgi:tetraprenyl-beta-curcumene synthase
VQALRARPALAASALAYGSTVLPHVRAELAHWDRRSREIPDASLRRSALAALRKRGNIAGAALFAVLAPPALRARTARALVAVQGAYNYLDTLAEQPSADPVRNGRRLHEALLAALDPLAAPGPATGPDDCHGDYYAGLGSRANRSRGSGVRASAEHDDGGYLRELLDVSRACLAALPSYPLVAPAARSAAARIVAFQSLNLGERHGSHEGLERWARAHTPAGSGLRWWETAAAAGSSLGVYALVALAADARLEASEIPAVQDAYFPWIGALHSLLDSLVDVAEDRREGQRNLLRYYSSTQHAAASLASIAAHARAHAHALPRHRRHEAMLAAMVGYYLSAPTASVPDARVIAGAVARAAGPAARSALPLLRAARVLAPRAPVGIARATATLAAAR